MKKRRKKDLISTVCCFPPQKTSIANRSAPFWTRIELSLYVINWHVNNLAKYHAFPEHQISIRALHSHTWQLCLIFNRCTIVNAEINQNCTQNCSRSRRYLNSCIRLFGYLYWRFDQRPFGVIGGGVRSGITFGRIRTRILSCCMASIRTPLRSVGLRRSLKNKK